MSARAWSCVACVDIRRERGQRGKRGRGGRGGRGEVNLQLFSLRGQSLHLLLISLYFLSKLISFCCFISIYLESIKITKQSGKARRGNERG